jgi:hypothetical protein
MARPATAAQAGRYEVMTTVPPKGTRPEDHEEEEVYPPDFIYALIDFMEDVCRIEAHVWAAEEALRKARTIDEIRLTDGGLEATLGRERAYFLLNSVADAAEEAAERAHKLRPELVAYCSRQRIELWRKLDEEESGQRGEVGLGGAGEVGQASESGDVTEAPPEATKVVEATPEAAEVVEAMPEAAELKDPGAKPGRKGRGKGSRA